MNKKGAITDLFILAVIGFIIVIFFVAWTYGHGLITQELVGITDSGSDLVNITDAAQNTFGQADQGIAVLRWMSFLIIFALALSILISNFLVKAHPVFFIIYVFIVIIAVVFGAILSNAYETLFSDTGSALHTTFLSFGGANAIMLNLPVWLAVIGIFGAILLFAGIQRDSGLGGGI